MPEIMDKHGSRIKIFESTLEILEQGWYLATDGQKVYLPSVGEVMGAAQMYSRPPGRGTDGKPLDRKADDVLPGRKAEVVVENLDCVVAAKQLIDEGYNPAMLNLADLYTPGGLVEYGSGAQEENLCRRSNLILSLYQFSPERVRDYGYLGLELRKEAQRYPMDVRFGGIYSGVVTFFRASEDEDSQLENVPYNIPVISVAAINGPRIGSDGMMVKQDAEITLDKMRTIFRIGMDHGHDSLVLSALGCGAFANPPAHIARLFHQVIEEDEFRGAFRLIDFAILDGYKTGLRHNPDGNLYPFQQEFSR